MDPVEFFTQWLARNYGKLILLAVVLVVAALIDKALTKVVRRILDKSQVPNASIFVNILRVVVWAFAIGTLLQPVFGINPTTLFTALGIGGLAVSLGLKDTIANVIGGFGLMLGRVISPAPSKTSTGVRPSSANVTATKWSSRTPSSTLHHWKSSIHRTNAWCQYRSPPKPASTWNI